MNLAFQVLLATLAAMAVEGVLLYFILPMLREQGAVRTNYRGVDIPVSAGISFPLTLLTLFSLYSLFSVYDEKYGTFLIGVLFMSFLGFIDDMLGRRDTLGFKGHFGALFRGKLTTGGLKALGGGLLSFFVALSVAKGWGDVVADTLILALFANLENLLDLRPGRAVKGFVTLGAVIFAAAKGNVPHMLLWPLLGAVLCYFPMDLKARAMLGDAGSNVLGFALGYLVVFLPLTARLVFLLLLVAVHVYTEKFSLTETIEKNSLLKAIDRMGRNEAD